MEHDCPQVMTATFTLNGKVFHEDAPLTHLMDATLRLRERGLVGGMPTPDFANMKTEELRGAAHELGVPVKTKKDGKWSWRQNAELIPECQAAALRSGSSQAVPGAGQIEQGPTTQIQQEPLSEPAGSSEVVSQALLGGMPTPDFAKHWEGSVEGCRTRAWRSG